MSQDDIKRELKNLIVDQTDRDFDPEAIDNDEPLFGPRARLGLDSIDGLQISMALQKRYGLIITDPKEMRRALKSINTLAVRLRDRA